MRKIRGVLFTIRQVIQLFKRRGCPAAVMSNKCPLNLTRAVLVRWFVNHSVWKPDWREHMRISEDINIVSTDNYLKRCREMEW